MDVVTANRHHPLSSAADDPLLPWLCSIKNALDKFGTDPDGQSPVLNQLVSDCIRSFKCDARYQNDVRFLRVWFIYMDSNGEFESVHREMEDSKICLNNSLLYEGCAAFLEAKGKLVDAFRVYQLGLSRKAEPIDRLKKAQDMFLNRMLVIVNACSSDKSANSTCQQPQDKYINPWSASTMENLLQKINPRLMKFDGYHLSSKDYPGKAPLSSLRNSSRNKIMEIGGRKYQIKGCAGQGGFAKVFKAYINSNPDDVVALKIQKPPFPWEFYMYRQLDKCILDTKRSNFGSAQRMHQYSDCSILICDYLSHGTLQDAINSYLVVGGFMEEELCIYYTIEMLHILETLQSVNIIHGDFKPDNLLIRYARDELTDRAEDIQERSGPWRDQGLCLVDWGRGIDLSLFPSDIEFMGDSCTSGFRCIEMQENKPWTFQVDTYGLCVVVHMMLHGSYMEIEKKSSDGGYIYMPKKSFKRYWQVELWKNLFTRLLNISAGDHQRSILQDLRKSFLNYLCSNPQLVKKLRHLLAKQRASLCSA